MSEYCAVKMRGFYANLLVPIIMILTKSPKAKAQFLNTALPGKRVGDGGGEGDEDGESGEDCVLESAHLDRRRNGGRDEGRKNGVLQQKRCI